VHCAKDRCTFSTACGTCKSRHTAHAHVLPTGATPALRPHEGCTGICCWCAEIDTSDHSLRAPKKSVSVLAFLAWQFAGHASCSFCRVAAVCSSWQVQAALAGLPVNICSSAALCGSRPSSSSRAQSGGRAPSGSSSQTGGRAPSASNKTTSDGRAAPSRHPRFQHCHCGPYFVQCRHVAFML
jgi:hypothetical protein